MRAATSLVVLAVMAALYGCAAQVDSESDVEHTSEAVTSIPRFDHVVIAIMENEDESAIIGNTSAPYINSLASQGASFTNMHGITHPSQPNYIGLFSGSTQGVTDDSCPKTFSTANLGKQLLDAGFTIKAYSEDLPSVGFTGCTSGKYARKHAPWTNFSNFPHTNELPFTSFPAGNFASLPTVSFVIPNLCNDMHDCSVATGDTWLKNNLDSYVQWSKTHNSLLILTWDEDDFTTVNQIATVFVGAQVQPGNYSENINHYNVLHTLESMYGLSQLGASAAPISDVWSATAPSNDFSVALNPTLLTLAQGASGSSTVSTTVSSGAAQTVSLAVSGLPAGVTGSFSPSSLSSGQSAALNLTASTSATAGAYNLAITATGAQATHSASLSLTVTQTGGSSGLTNGDFEAGSLTGWRRSGSTSVGSDAHEGTHSATVGSSAPTNGDSSIAQTFTAPAGSSTLSFWYKVHCPDTVTYDWATATLTDAATSTATTVVAKTCTNNGSWVQASASVVAGHSYTLKLVSHDDDYAGDATYVSYDDVQLH